MKEPGFKLSVDEGLCRSAEAASHDHHTTKNIIEYGWNPRRGGAAAASSPEQPSEHVAVRQSHGAAEMCTRQAARLPLRARATGTSSNPTNRLLWPGDNAPVAGGVWSGHEGRGTRYCTKQLTINRPKQELDQLIMSSDSPQRPWTERESHNQDWRQETAPPPQALPRCVHSKFTMAACRQMYKTMLLFCRNSSFKWTDPFIIRFQRWRGATVEVQHTYTGNKLRFP